MPLWKHCHDLGKDLASSFVMPCHLIRSLFESIILLIRVYAPLCTFNKISELMNPAAPFKGRKPIFEERTRTGCFKELSAKTPKAQKGKSWASSSAEERWEGAIVIFSQDQGRLADFSFFATLQARAFPFSFIFRAGNIHIRFQKRAQMQDTLLWE